MYGFDTQGIATWQSWFHYKFNFCHNIISFGQLLLSVFDLLYSYTKSNQDLDQG